MNTLIRKRKLLFSFIVVILAIVGLLKAVTVGLVGRNSAPPFESVDDYIWVFRFAVVSGLFGAAGLFFFDKIKLALSFTLIPLFFFVRWAIAYYGVWHTSQQMEFYDIYPSNNPVASFLTYFFDIWDLVALATTVGLGFWQVKTLVNRRTMQ